jgi:hypothetical protein
MPILSSNYISNWYKLKDVDTDDFYVIESLTSNFAVNQNKKDLIQGEAGVHVMGATDSTWTTDLRSPILIIEQDDDTKETFQDILSVFSDSYNKLRTFYNDISEVVANDPTHSSRLKQKDLLNKAMFEISSTSAATLNLIYNCKYDFKFNILKSNTLSNSNTKDPDTHLLNPDRTNNKVDKHSFLARTVRNYDVSLYVHENGEKYVLRNAKLTFDFDYNRMFFMNANTSIPFYEPKGYSVEGEVELIIPADKLDTFLFPAQNDDTKLIPGQNFMQLVRDKVNLALIFSDGRFVKVGLSSLSNSINVMMREGITTVSLRFNAYTSVI